MIKRVTSATFNFRWKNKIHYLNYNNGGLKAIEFEFEYMIRVFKLIWIKAYLAQPGSLWFHINESKCLFQEVGGLEF